MASLPKSTPSTSNTKIGSEQTRLLRRIIKKVTEEGNSIELNTPCTNFLQQASKYTGLSELLLLKLKDCRSIFVAEVKEVDRSIIYEGLVNMYTVMGILPTTRLLYKELFHKIPPYIDIESFRKILVKTGFVWKRIQNDTYVIIEKPEIIFERYHYLKNILFYREESRNIYFVDESALEVSGNYFSTIQSDKYAKVMPEGMQQRVVYAVSKTGVHCIQYIDSFNAEAIQNWVSEELIPYLSVPSVIVFSNAEPHCGKIADVPTEDSLKIEMMEWLERNNVTFDSQISKLDLFTLIENYTDLDANMYKIDNILKGLGHSVLRIPDCIKQLTPANLIFRLIKKNTDKFVHGSDVSWSEDVKRNFESMIECIPKATFILYDEYIAKQELKMFNSDMKVDEVFDKLVKNANTVYKYKLDDIDSDLPSCSDSE